LFDIDAPTGGVMPAAGDGGVIVCAGAAGAVGVAGGAGFAGAAAVAGRAGGLGMYSGPVWPHAVSRARQAISANGDFTIRITV
jgi:hypothetical protein